MVKIIEALTSRYNIKTLLGKFKPFGGTNDISDVKPCVARQLFGIFNLIFRNIDTDKFTSVFCHVARYNACSRSDVKNFLSFYAKTL